MNKHSEAYKFFGKLMREHKRAILILWTFGSFEHFSQHRSPVRFCSAHLPGGFGDFHYGIIRFGGRSKVFWHFSGFSALFRAPAQP